MKPKSQKQINKKIEKEADILFAKVIKERDNWSCAVCGRKDCLNTHHIIPREDRRTRHDLLNGITLCILHHKFSLEISPHKNAFEFFCWLEKNRPDQFTYLKQFLKFS